MITKMIRVRMPLDFFMKYKVFCAMGDKSMTEMTEHVLREYVKQQSETIKIIDVSKKGK